MNKSELISQIVASADISKTTAEDFLQAFTTTLSNTLEKGDRMKLIGFGTFSTSKRAARTGRNPQTGKEIQIPSKNVVKFKVGTKLADTLN